MTKSPKQLEYINSIESLMIDEIVTGIKNCSLKRYDRGYKNIFYAANGFYENMPSLRKYSGINQLYLMLRSINNMYQLPIFGTFKQLKKFGAKVRKGQKATKVIHRAMNYVYDNERCNEDFFKNEASKRNLTLFQLSQETGNAMYSSYKIYAVFNIDQCEDPESLVDRFMESHQHLKEEKDQLMNKIVDNLIDNKNLKVIHKLCIAPHYNVTDDYVTLPPMKYYKIKDYYYSTLIHELAHWTGNNDRVPRDNYSIYAEEELTAELTAILFSLKFGLEKEPNENSLFYIKKWSEKVEDSTQYLRNSLGLCNAIIDYLVK